VFCAIRETEEETGLHLKNVIFLKALNCVVLEENYHYIEIFMQGEVDTDTSVKLNCPVDVIRLFASFWTYSVS
jgi:8-oxo-dGTP pyrophosphatase MutT (NUDIX family)